MPPRPVARFLLYEPLEPQSATDEMIGAHREYSDPLFPSQPEEGIYFFSFMKILHNPQFILIIDFEASLPEGGLFSLSFFTPFAPIHIHTNTNTNKH